MRPESVSHDWTTAERRDLPLVEPLNDAQTTSNSADAAIVPAWNDKFERERVVRRWPQVALDGRAAIPVIALDAGSRRYIARVLQRVGYKVAGFVEPQALLSALTRWQYDVLVLSGHEEQLKWCSAVHVIRPELPMLFVLQNGSSATIAQVLDAGADCLEAPFLEADLVARAKLLFRIAWRKYGLTLPGSESRIRLDVARPRVRIEDRDIALTEVEYRTLWVLAQSQGGVSRFCDIEKSVWGASSCERRTALRRVIQSLRRKLTGRSDDQHLLKTERCVGYRLLLR